jgi:ketosteroid isomerase-like protein
MTDPTEVARRVFDAIEAGDMDTLRSLYHPDAQIWHNTTGVSVTRDDTMQLIEWMNANMPPTRYVDRHLSATDDGFVERHTVVITRSDGSEVLLPCCVVATVEDGRITNLYEYFDSAAQAATGIEIGAD